MMNQREEIIEPSKVLAVMSEKYRNKADNFIL